MTRAVLLLLLLGCSTAGVETDGDPADSDVDSDSDSDSDSEQAPSPGRYFPDDAPWYTDISSAPVDPSSAEKIAALQELGWGFGRMQIDFSFEILDADASTPRRSFEKTSAFYEPDCDHVEVPIPAGGNLEGEEGYRCTKDGDCHLIVAERNEGRLYEMWRADIDGETFRGGCLAVWDMTRTYPPNGRGEQCTSADAAGYPIAPMLFTADEVASGEINHALRFILPNTHIDNDGYHHPASHSTRAGADGPIPYGARLRLKPDVDLSGFEPGAQVIARAMQRYGMVLADGGNITLTALSDRRTTAKWADILDSPPHALRGLEPEDFELVELGAFQELTFDCVRN